MPNPYQLRSSAKTPDTAPLTAVVARVDDDGIWVVSLGQDMRTPIGPCRGTSDLKKGDVCLLIRTQERPWAIGDVAHLVDQLDQLTQRVTSLENRL